jgi:hypothetical protein
MGGSAVRRPAGCRPIVGGPFLGTSGARCYGRTGPSIITPGRTYCGRATYDKSSYGWPSLKEFWVSSGIWQEFHEIFSTRVRTVTVSAGEAADRMGFSLGGGQGHAGTRPERRGKNGAIHNNAGSNLLRKSDLRQVQLWMAPFVLCPNHSLPLAAMLRRIAVTKPLWLPKSGSGGSASRQPGRKRRGAEGAEKRGRIPPPFFSSPRPPRLGVSPVDFSRA